MHPDSYNSSISSGPSLHKAGQSIRADFIADIPTVYLFVMRRQKPRSVEKMSSNALFRLDLNMMYE